MGLKFEQKKTTELTDSEFAQIVALYKKVFDRSILIEELRRIYLSTPLGFSYHSLMKDGDTICGINSFEPSYFNYHCEKRLFASSVTTMVDVKYRGATNFYYMVSKAYPYLLKEGVSLVYAYPNKNSYPVFTKMKLTKDIGEMFTYILPLRIGSIKPRLAWLNMISYCLCKCWVGVCGLVASNKCAIFPVEKDIATYDTPRYERSIQDVYKHICIKDDVLMHYRVKEYEGVRTAFLIDLNPKSARNFVDAIKYLLESEGKDIDMILYPGYLPFSITGMIKLPKKYAPKKFSLTVKVLNESLFGDDIWDICNWDTNLSNYDLI